MNYMHGIDETPGRDGLFEHREKTPLTSLFKVLWRHIGKKYKWIFAASIDHDILQFLVSIFRAVWPDLNIVQWPGSRENALMWYLYLVYKLFISLL